MKASELIQLLARLMVEHGDLPVHANNDEWGTSFPVTSATFEPAVDNSHRVTNLPNTPDCFVIN